MLVIHPFGPIADKSPDPYRSTEHAPFNLSATRIGTQRWSMQSIASAVFIGITSRPVRKRNASIRMSFLPSNHSASHSTSNLGLGLAGTNVPPRVEFLDC